MKLHERVDTVASRDDLVRFVHALLADLQANPADWENPSLERYLGAMAAWIEDMDGYYLNQGQPVPESPDWKTLADILYAARIYE